MIERGDLLRAFPTGGPHGDFTGLAAQARGEIPDRGAAAGNRAAGKAAAMNALSIRRAPTLDPVERRREIAKYYAALDERQRREAAAEVAGLPQRIHESARNGLIAFNVSLDRPPA
jgi:hypothetical protein